MKITIEDSRIFEGCIDIEEAKLTLVNTLIEGTGELAGALKQDQLDLIESMCVSAINSVKRERKNRLRRKKKKKNKDMLAMFLNFRLQEGK